MLFRQDWGAPAYADAYVLLGGIFEKQGKEAEAVGVYNKGLATEGTPDQYKLGLLTALCLRTRMS